MTTYTVLIECSPDDRLEIWQAVHPSETVRDSGTARDVASAVAHNQTIVEGQNWRVRVWTGANADTGVPAAAEWIPPADE